MDKPSTDRTFTVVVMVVAALVGRLLVALAPDDAPAARATALAAPMMTVAPTTTTFHTVGAAPTTTAPAATTAPPPSTAPGLLPQTTDEPATSDATFVAGAQDLWNAIAQDDPTLGLPFFFPKSAYLQVKAISDPAGDYQNRLIANFEQDVHTLHAQLGANAAAAQYQGIDVPTSQAVIVQPGEESNKLPYWRVYGTTLRYSVNGSSYTLPVTSLISWRGEWYVVHLGAIR